ncbi:class I SAM-dependent methyltransferase [Gordonia sp. VNK21]|uniref:class I SAM-dependent methyltransferase n=1 Tax=Gordonia sp. VNK21 TaxID=3382483 RepID=UPI0038D46334
MARRPRWTVTAADISATALSTARARAAQTGLDSRIRWVQADLARWEPAQTWDLVVTSYAHADIGQLALYRRLAECVAPGGTMLVIGHLHHAAGGGDHHPEEATATLEGALDVFGAAGWQIDSAYENTRTAGPGAAPITLRDMIVRTHRAT